jgi:hypothetical protein
MACVASPLGLHSTSGRSRLASLTADRIGIVTTAGRRKARREAEKPEKHIQGDFLHQQTFHIGILEYIFIFRHSESQAMLQMTALFRW